MGVEISKYKGHDIISLTEDSNDKKFPTRISMGVAKARLVIKYIAALEEFVEKYGGDKHGAGGMGKEADN